MDFSGVRGYLTLVSDKPKEYAVKYAVTRNICFDRLRKLASRLLLAGVTGLACLGQGQALAGAEVPKLGGR